jgi:hypothetical protein
MDFGVFASRYVTNRMGTTLPFDPRDVALRAAIAANNF